jgi:hypothetical protein
MFFVFAFGDANFAIIMNGTPPPACIIAAGIHACNFVVDSVFLLFRARSFQ